MATITAQKGFIKNAAGEIILPISRGELIFDSSGNIALHSADFKAEAAERDAETKVIKSGTGRYGLVSPEDLLDLQEALARITNLEETSADDSKLEELKQNLQDLITKVGYQKGDTDSNGNPVDSNTGIYAYVDSQIINQLAAADALKFKGTLGVDGTVSTLPTTGVNNGDTYKVITTGIYASQSAKVGDLLIALYSTGKLTWELVPSGNEIETFIKVKDSSNNQQVLSGEVEIDGTNGVSVQYDETNKKVVISGTGSTSVDELAERVTTLESTTSDLSTQVGNTQAEIDEAVTTYKQVVEVEKDSEGNITSVVNGDKLVKTSAVYETANNILTYVTEHYLQAEILNLDAALSDDQKAYLSGTITN